MHETPLVPEPGHHATDQAVDRSEAPRDQRESEPTSASETPADTGSSPIEQRFTRHRAGDTVVLYDRLEQTTWVQADYDPADLV